MTRQESMIRIIEAVQKLKDNVSQETLLKLYSAFTSSSGIGSEFLVWNDVVEAINSGLSTDKGASRGAKRKNQN